MGDKRAALADFCRKRHKKDIHAVKDDCIASKICRDCLRFILDSWKMSVNYNTIAKDSNSPDSDSGAGFAQLISCSTSVLALRCVQLALLVTCGAHWNERGAAMGQQKTRARACTCAASYLSPSKLRAPRIAKGDGTVESSGTSIKPPSGHFAKPFMLVITIHI